MSKFLSNRFKNMQPYRPGIQPHDRDYVKLNANETTLSPSPKVRAALTDALVDGLGRYADPYCLDFRRAVAQAMGVATEEVFVGNGSDEVLAIAFRTFFGDEVPVAFPDITYNFYRDWCTTFDVPFCEIPLLEDFSVDVDALAAFDGHVVLVNPNAPTGMVVPREAIERIMAARSDRLVIVDEAYIDYGGESCVPLIGRHRNLIVVQTMSKSRHLAGAHIGFAIAASELIGDMRDVKFSVNPFNVSALTSAISIAAIEDAEHLEAFVAENAREREELARELCRRGFHVLPSSTNFVLAKIPKGDAAALTGALKEHGVLVRHYGQNRIRDWLRITVGTATENAALLQALDACLA